MRRPNESLLSGIGALALGALAATLPALLGEPPAERPALRGLALAATFGIVATVLFALAGWRWGTQALDAASGGAEPRRTKAPLRAMARIGLPLLAVALPSLLLGVESGELSTLSALLQSVWGWRTPVHFALMGALGLLAVFALARLAGSVRVWPPRRLLAPVPGLFLFLLGTGAAVTRLALLPAPVGLERATKGLALVLSAALLVAALLARPLGIARRDLRGLVIATGLALGGIFSFGFALDYLAPSTADLLEVHSEVDRDGCTLLDGTLRDRPDLHGIFGLAPGATRLELVGVASGPPGGAWVATPQWVRAGLLHYEPSGEEPLRRATAPLPSEDGIGGEEIFLRSRWCRWLDRPSGLRASNPLSWAVSPSLRFAVSITWDQGSASAARRRAAGVGMQEDGPEPRFQIEVAGRSPLALSPEVVASDLPWAPRVLWIDDRAVRFLIVSDQASSLKLSEAAPAPRTARPESTGTVLAQANLATASSRLVRMRPRYPGAATYLVAERRWTDQGASAQSVGQEMHFFPDRRHLLVGCFQRGSTDLGWCVLDLDLPGRPVEIGPLPSPRAMAARALPLSTGAVAALWHEGVGRAALHFRLSTFGSSGRELHTVDLAGSKAVNFAGELEDGSIAIARYAGPSLPYSVATFGWRLETYEPSTGAVRTLAEDLGAFRSQGLVSRVFLERSGRLVVPTAKGLVDARTSPRSFRPTLDSTARYEARLLQSGQSPAPTAPSMKK